MNKHLLLIAAAMALTACRTEPQPQPKPDPDPDPIVVEVESVKVTPEELNLEAGKTANVKVAILPQNATDTTYSLKSLNSNIATVDGTGLVKALSAGETFVVATASGKSDSCKVTVTGEIVRITGFTLTPKHVQLVVGQTQTMEVVIRPKEATEVPVWSSDDESVATVSQSGIITAVGPGTTNVRIKSFLNEKSVDVLVVPQESLRMFDANVRLVPGTQYEACSDTVDVARGETAIIQLGLETQETISNLQPSLLNFGKSSGSIIEPRMYWERYVKCSRHWDAFAGGPADDEVYSTGDRYPDPLMPVDEWKTEATSGERALLWTEFDIPRSLAAGFYEGEIKIDGVKGGAPVSFSHKFCIHVHDVSLPEKQTMNVIQWEADYNAMNNGEQVDFYAWPEFQKIVVNFMNDYGQNCWRLRFASKSNMGGTCSVDYTTDPPTYKYDFDYKKVGWPREFQLYVDECPDLRQIHGHQVGMRQEDEEGNNYLVLSAYYLNPENLDEQGRPKLDYGYAAALDNSPEALRIKEGFSEYFRQLGEWLESHKLADGRSWLDLYAQTISDEPKDDLAADYSEIARLIKVGCPEMKITDAIETNKIDPRYLDYPCPTLKFIEQCPAQEGQEQWMYTCMSPQGNYANRFIRIPLIKTRIVHWCNYYYNAPNYLHWGLMYWQGADDPYGDVCGQFIGGDMYIIYPGYKKVYPCIRLCAMRDGIRDFDLLKMVEAKGGKALADEYLKRVVQGPAKYNTDAADFAATHREMLEYLEK